MVSASAREKGPHQRHLVQFARRRKQIGGAGKPRQTGAPPPLDAGQLRPGGNLGKLQQDAQVLAQVVDLLQSEHGHQQGRLGRVRQRTRQNARGGVEVPAFRVRLPLRLLLPRRPCVRLLQLRTGRVVLGRRDHQRQPRLQKGTSPRSVAQAPDLRRLDPDGTCLRTLGTVKARSFGREARAPRR